MKPAHHRNALSTPDFVLRHDWAQDTLRRACQALHPDDPFLRALQRQASEDALLATQALLDERQSDQGSSLRRREPADAAHA
jgi:hypothetical protein